MKLLLTAFDYTSKKSGNLSETSTFNILPQFHTGNYVIVRDKTWKLIEQTLSTKQDASFLGNIQKMMFEFPSDETSILDDFE